MSSTTFPSPQVEHYKDLLMTAYRVLEGAAFESLRKKIITAVDPMAYDSEGVPLKAGALYCLFLRDPDIGWRDGRLVWFSYDGNIYDADDGELVQEDEFDILVRQGAAMNPAYATKPEEY